MQDINIHFQDYSFVKVECSPSIGMELRDYFSFEVEGARFSPPLQIFRLGWKDKTVYA